MSEKTMQEKRCAGCGGQMQFNPEAQMLLCAACGEADQKSVAAAEAAINATLNCPNCGAELEHITGSRQSKCDSCDSVFNILSEGEDCELTGEIPENHKFIAPFTVSEQQYQKGMISWLANEKFTPADVFEKMAIIRSEGCYIPHYYCVANYKVNWTASIGYDRIETFVVRTKNGMVTRTRVVTDWFPHSSVASGTVTNLIEATHHMAQSREKSGAANCKDLKRGIRESSFGLVDGGNFVEIDRKQSFDPKFTAGFTVLPCDEPSNKAYDKAVIDAGIRSQITAIAPGDRIRNLQYHGDIIPDIFLVYRPNWVTLYTYGDKVCFSACDGTNDSRHFGTRPVCKDTKKRVRRWFMGFGLAALLAMIMWLLRYFMAGDETIELLAMLSLIPAGAVGLTAIIVRGVSISRGRKALGSQLDRYLGNTSEIFGRRSAKADPTL
ncbi:MAG: hypothetical protein FWE04_02670 [Oscillospiraceae bacterium]|nr:hypothetical protein [Oscillospiraceae bacterium]